MDRSALFESDACLLPGSFPSTGFQIRKQATFAGNNALRSIAENTIANKAKGFVPDSERDSSLTRRAKNEDLPLVV